MLTLPNWAGRGWKSGVSNCFLELSCQCLLAHLFLLLRLGSSQLLLDLVSELRFLLFFRYLALSLDLLSASLFLCLSGYCLLLGLSALRGVDGFLCGAFVVW